jgi:hypothetical protein
MATTKNNDPHFFSSAPFCLFNSLIAFLSLFTFLSSLIFHFFALVFQGGLSVAILELPSVLLVVLGNELYHRFQVCGSPAHIVPCVYSTHPFIALHCTNTDTCVCVRNPERKCSLSGQLRKQVDSLWMTAEVFARAVAEDFIRREGTALDPSYTSDKSISRLETDLAANAAGGLRHIERWDAGMGFNGSRTLCRLGLIQAYMAQKAIAVGPSTQEHRQVPRGTHTLPLELSVDSDQYGPIYGTKAIAVGRSGCACGAQQVKVWWGWFGRAHVLRGAWVCVFGVLSLKPVGLSGICRRLSLCGAPPQGVLCKAPLISEWAV